MKCKLTFLWILLILLLHYCTTWQGTFIAVGRDSTYTLPYPHTSGQSIRHYSFSLSLNTSRFMPDTLTILIDNTQYTVVMGDSSLLLYRNTSTEQFLNSLTSWQYPDGHEPTQLLGSLINEETFYVLFKNHLPRSYRIENDKLVELAPSIEGGFSVTATVAHSLGGEDDIFVILQNRNQLQFFSVQTQRDMLLLDFAMYCDKITTLYSLPPVRSDSTVSFAVECTLRGQSMLYHVIQSYQHHIAPEVTQLSVGVPVASAVHLAVRQGHSIAVYNRRYLASGVSRTHTFDAQIEKLIAFKADNETVFVVFTAGNDLTQIDSNTFLNSPPQGLSTLPGTQQTCDPVCSPHDVIEGKLVVTAWNGLTYDIVMLDYNRSLSTLTEVAQVSGVPIAPSFVTFIPEPDIPDCSAWQGTFLAMGGDSIYTLPYPNTCRPSIKQYQLSLSLNASQLRNDADHSLTILIEDTQYTVVMGDSSLLLYRNTSTEQFLDSLTSWPYPDGHEPTQLLGSLINEEAFYVMFKSHLPRSFRIEDDELVELDPSIEGGFSVTATVAHSLGRDDNVFIILQNRNQLQFFSEQTQRDTLLLDFAMYCDKITTLYSLPPVRSDSTVSFGVECTLRGQSMLYHVIQLYRQHIAPEVTQLSVGVPVASAVHLAVRQGHSITVYNRRYLASGVSRTHTFDAQIEKLIAFETDNETIFVVYTAGNDLTQIDSSTFLNNPLQGLSTLSGTQQTCDLVCSPHDVIEGKLVVTAWNGLTYDIVMLDYNRSLSALTEVARVSGVPIAPSFVTFIPEPDTTTNVISDATDTTTGILPATTPDTTGTATVGQLTTVTSDATDTTTGMLPATTPDTTGTATIGQLTTVTSDATDTTTGMLPATTADTTGTATVGKSLNSTKHNLIIILGSTLGALVVIIIPLTVIGCCIKRKKKPLRTIPERNKIPPPCPVSILVSSQQHTHSTLVVGSDSKPLAESGLESGYASLRTTPISTDRRGILLTHGNSRSGSPGWV